MARQKQAKTCNRCGQSDLYWKLEGSVWRLGDITGRNHSCKEYNRSKLADDASKGKAEQPPPDEGFNRAIADAMQGKTEQGQGDYKSQGEGQGKGEGQEGQGEGTESQQEGKQGQSKGEQGEQGEGENQSQQQGEGGSEPNYAQDVKAHKVYDRVKPQVQWEVAQQFDAMKRQLDARAQRNENTLTEQVNKHVQAKLAEIAGPAPEIVVKLPNGEKIGDNIKNAHPQFPLLLTCIQLRKNVMLVGPAGTGKTTAAEQAATALGLAFYPFSVGAQTSKTDIAGYQDAHSRLVRSLFREAYENGGIFLLDEVDAGNANVLTLLNSALSNGYFSFPDGVVKRHENFRCVAAANTFGNGADRQYVGRNQLDAATLDRFVKLNWKYDTALEGRLCTNKDWLKYVHTLRTARDKTGVRCVFSTRAVINGSDLLAAGVDRTTVEEIVLWNGISSDDREKLMEVV